MTRQTTNWLRDAHQCGTRIIRLIEGLDFDQYHSTEFPRLGVERYLITLGEALRVALRNDPGLKTELPEARYAIDLRNFLTHAYMHIDDWVVWTTITTKLPTLLEDIDHLIERRTGNDPTQGK